MSFEKFNLFADHNGVVVEMGGSATKQASPHSVPFQSERKPGGKVVERVVNVVSLRQPRASSATGKQWVAVSVKITKIGGNPGWKTRINQVQTVLPGGGAEAAGVREGDVIGSINGVLTVGLTSTKVRNLWRYHSDFNAGLVRQQAHFLRHQHSTPKPGRAGGSSPWRLPLAPPPGAPGAFRVGKPLHKSQRYAGSESGYL